MSFFPFKAVTWSVLVVDLFLTHKIFPDLIIFVFTTLYYNLLVHLSAVVKVNFDCQTLPERTSQVKGCCRSKFKFPPNEIIGSTYIN